MELMETVKNRRSIRKFKNKDVENKIIEDLVEFARLAPSAKNRQPWKFVVVKDKIKDQIADIANLVKKENMELISAISIGYPDETPKPRPRKEINEILEWLEEIK